MSYYRKVAGLLKDIDFNAIRGAYSRIRDFECEYNNRWYDRDIESWKTLVSKTIPATELFEWAHMESIVEQLERVVTPKLERDLLTLLVNSTDKWNDTLVCVEEKAKDYQDHSPNPELLADIATMRKFQQQCREIVGEVVHLQKQHALG